MKTINMFFKSLIFRFFLHVIFLIENRHRSASRITQAANPMSGKNSLEGTLPTFWVHISIDSSKVVLSFIWEIESFVGIENSSEDS